MKRLCTLVVCAVLVAALPAFAAESLTKRLAAAKAGQTIALPAGEFTGGVTLPAGVSLKGAGVGKTIIVGELKAQGGSGAQISDLTVRGGGLVVADAESVTVARVRVTGAPTGILLRGVKKGRIENCVSDHNRFGIVVSGSADAVVVNCTVADCSEMGISLAAAPNAAVFNNCVVGSAIALNIDHPGDMRIDHNLYFGLYIGKMKKQVGRRMLTAWQYLTGLDRHSVQMPVTFINPAASDFSPKGALPWALDRATTTDWGVRELAGVKAPETDMLGRARNGRFDAGAVEAVVKAPRAADGTFTVTEEAGTKSAGIFTKDGMLVSYLFHNLPLAPGEYSFWLPVRDELGRPIPAGEYEVRLAQSDFQWKYLAHVGNNGEDPTGMGTSPQNPKLVTFAPGDLLVMLEGLSEDGMGVRAYDITTGKVRWHVPGSAQALGIATGKDGIIYVLRGQDPKTGESRLTRINPATGDVIPYPGSNVGHVFPITSGKAFSMAALDKRLYVADMESNKVFILEMADGKVAGTLTVTSPRFIAGDEKTGLLWVAGGGAVVAMGTDGKEVARSTAVPEPVAVAVCDGKIAVASSKTGKVHFFDSSDPKNLKPLREIGKGSLFGEYSPDRFFFQPSPGWQNGEDKDGIRIWDLTLAGLAMDAVGRLGVADFHRVSLFDPNGKNLWHTILVWGGPKPSYSTQNRRVWEGAFSFTLDHEAGTWKTEAVWDASQVTAHLPKDHEMIGDFAENGKAFAVYVTRSLKDAQMVVARLDGHVMVPVLKVLVENGKVISREDTNRDGKITGDDTPTPLMDAAGKPFQPGVIQRYCYLEPDGSIATSNVQPFLWKRTPGLSANGAPIYEGKNYTLIPTEDSSKSICPYDFKPGTIGTTQKTGLLSEGGYVGLVGVRGSGGTGLNNAAGTDLAGFDKDGRRRWMRLLAQHKGMGGAGTVNDITLSIVYYSMESVVVDPDGLGLGGFCEPPQLEFFGYWISPSNLNCFKGSDGKFHLLGGDHFSGRMPWFRLDNQQSLKRSKKVFTLAKDKADALAAMEWTPAPAIVAQPQPRVRIPRLGSPMKIDGDPEKWRKAGIAPSIVVGPFTADGPQDCSGIIRMAYEGQNLYFQVLQFDDVVTFHQKGWQYMQDSVELAINGTFPSGFQFIVYKDADGQDLVHRHRFFANFPAIKLRPEHAPRVVRVLDDAQSIPERSILEAMYGVDLSKSKVIVTEFMFPMDKETWASAPEKEIVQLGPGKTFWLGFFLDDNDHPYTDTQGVNNWPSTFGMFSSTEEGAIAVCE